MTELDKLGEILLNWRLKKVIPYIKGRVLDVGCGTNKLVKLYRNGIGIDVHQFGGADLILKDTSITPFDDNSYDTITIIATLNHIPNREEVLTEMYRILKPTGKLIVTMIPPRISKVWHIIRSPWDRDQKERGMVDGEVYGINNKNLENIIKIANFKIVKKSKFMFGINNLIIASKN